ncbi:MULTISPECIES: hypothetical protein [unclassified Dysgonomonas]|uniref:hypothetical protein n=1 Tax=unclassified Dysgonomonas TaxID=2630389 RepID=UPI0025C5EDDC|nr:MULTISPECIES: hypothetical protein [unclassified Dysgonomonas]HMM02734.1 hypothetical protein [Dysgonomonas sp.]
MKSLIKWMALLAIFATAGKLFMDAFLPEYEQWREKYPPEPEETDDDETEKADNVIQAQDLFKPDAEKFAQDAETYNEKGGL